MQEHADKSSPAAAAALGVLVFIAQATGPSSRLSAHGLEQLRGTLHHLHITTSPAMMHLDMQVRVLLWYRSLPCTLLNAATTSSSGTLSITGIMCPSNQGSEAHMGPAQVLPVMGAAVLSCLGASRPETSGQTAPPKASLHRAPARSSDAARLGKLLQTSLSCSLRSGPIAGMTLGSADTGESLVLPSRGPLPSCSDHELLLHKAAAAAAAVTVHEGSRCGSQTELRGV